MSKSYGYKSLTLNYQLSSSGGAFSKIVEVFYSNGEGVVYGAIMDENTNVVHDRATTLEDCCKFRKSKYVRSDSASVHQQVANDLNEGLRVLFTGSPCQIGALKTYLGKREIDTSNLYLVDFICNGAPSPRTWRDYVSWVEKKVGKRMIYFGFREKGDPNNPYLTLAKFEDGSIIKDNSITACYNRLFLQKYIVPEGCFNCVYKKEERVSDITIGDFWGSENVFERKDLKKGVSLVIVNSKKGETLFDNSLCSEEREIVVECHNKEYLPFQLNLQGVSTKPLSYGAFWSDYQMCGIDYVLRKYADMAYPKVILYPLRRFARNIKSLLRR